MLPTIISGGTHSSRADFIRSLLSTPTELIRLTTKTSLKIGDIKDLQKRLINIPRLPRLVWIEEANSLTLPAQNALLKLLEEPPVNTRFYLTCQQSSSILPTIRSRCTQQRLADSATFNPQVLTDLKNTLAQSVGMRLLTTPKLDRETALTFFNSLQTALKIKLRDPHLSVCSRQLLSQIGQLVISASDALSHNCNVTLVYTSFLLHLPKSK